MHARLQQRLVRELDDLRGAGTYKTLRTIAGPIGRDVGLGADASARVLLMCSNDYLGLANDPRIHDAAIKGLDAYGASTASVRFICGTQSIHLELEDALAALHGTEAALTYSSCWAANTGLFAALAEPGDTILSDALNHASIIDGCRLVQKGVARQVYRHGDVDDLAAKLAEAEGGGQIFIATDGVFSMEGDLAPLDRIAPLARDYEAVLIVDDSHGLGVVGPSGLGTAEHFGVMDQVDIYTGTLGKALAAGTGGFVCAPRAVVEMLIQRSRPHLFSNALPASVAAAGLEAVRILREDPGAAARLRAKAGRLRTLLRDEGLAPLDGESAIVPVIVGDTAVAIAASDCLLRDGIMVTGFGFPVVPEGEARLRFQVSLAHEEADLARAARAAARCLAELGSGRPQA